MIPKPSIPVRLAAGAALAAMVGLSPGLAQACACGCDIFDVGGASMMPMEEGGEMFVEYDFVDQNENQSGDHWAPAADNEDKQIRSHFVTFGGRYAFNRDWTVTAQVPVWNRLFRTENEDGGVDRFNHTAVGDIRLTAVYTGLSKDMSTGLILGVKLPTGDWTYPNFDRDTQIGTGSTDIMLGAYHQGRFGRTGTWSYFVRGLWDAPLATQGGYEPGQEFSAAGGVAYSAGSLGGGKIRVAPLLQLLVSSRARDRGWEGDPENTGYDRVMISPGVEFSAGAWKVYGDVEIPLYQRVNGNQLVAPVLFKTTLSRRF